MTSNDKQSRNEIIQTGAANDKSLPAETRNRIAKGLANITEAIANFLKHDPDDLCMRVSIILFS